MVPQRLKRESGDPQGNSGTVPAAVIPLQGPCKACHCPETKWVGRQQGPGKVRRPATKQNYFKAFGLKAWEFQLR